MPRSPILAIVLLPLLGCVPRQVRETQAAVQARLTLMDTRQALLEETLEDTTDKLEQAQSTLRLIGQDKGDLLEALDQTSEELRALRGQNEELRFALDDTRAQLEAYMRGQEVRQLHDEARLDQIEESLGLEPPPRPVLDEGEGPGLGAAVGPDGSALTEPGEGEGSGPSEGGEDGERGLPESARGKLDKAVQHMEDGQQGVARYVLEAAIEEHVGDPLLDEIRYRLGETWFNEGAWGKAALAFQAVIDNHPRSQWAPWAGLRQGEAFLELGQKDGAVIFFEGVLEDYPDSDAAAEARKQLRGL